MTGNKRSGKLCLKTPSSARERAIFSSVKDGEAGDIGFIVDGTGCSQRKKGPLEARSSLQREPKGGYVKIASLISCLFALCLTGCYQPIPKLDRKKIESMANPEAYLLSLLDQRYTNPDVHCELGRYYHSQHQDTKALHHYETALGFDPAHRPTQAAIIKLYLDEGKTDQAQALMQRYQRQISNSPQQLVDLGKALQGEGLDKYAFSCYQQALALGPNLASTNKYMGLYYLKQNDLDQAKQYLKRSFDVNPNQPDVAKHLGELGVTVQVQTQYGTGTTAPR